MALGDYVETTFVEGAAPGISATRLNNNENKTAELDSAQAAHLANTTTMHGATSAATASKLIIRDAAGRAKVVTPSAADDIARKDTVDAVQTNLTAHVAAKSSSSVLGHMKVGTGLPVDVNGVVSAPRVAVGLFTRDMTLASGTQAISGLGFIPRKVTFYAVIDGLPGASCWGFDIGTARHCLTNAYATAPGDFYSDRAALGASIEIWTSDIAWGSAKIQSFDASGFTLSWVREGVPNDTAEIMYMAEE